VSRVTGQDYARRAWEGFRTVGRDAADGVFARQCRRRRASYGTEWPLARGGESADAPISGRR
jgi:hypothetical protein